MKPWSLVARAVITVVTLALALPATTIPAAALGSGCNATAGTTLTQCGFETPVLGDGIFSYGTTGSAWNFPCCASGIASNHSGFTDSQLAPDGVQVAFIQGPSSFSQSIGGFVDGVYTLTFSAAQRLNGGGNQDFEILLDALQLGTFKPASTSYTDLRVSFIATPGTHTLKFQGLDTAGGDNTAFIDTVRLNHGALGIGGTVRWDLIAIVTAGTTREVVAGGTDVGKDSGTGDTVSLTGSGQVSFDEGQAAGGGTFVVNRSDGTVVTSGVYVVTGFNSFQKLGGSLALTTLVDGIGVIRATTAGILSVKVHLVSSAGTAEGVLEVHCFLPGSSPFTEEGIRLTVSPVPGVTLNFTQDTPDHGVTLFHSLGE